MSRTTNQPPSPQVAFLQYFEHSVYKDFSFWKEFSVKALALYENESKQWQQKIRKFDAEYTGSKPEFDEDGRPLMTDGWEVYEDETLRLENQHNIILPWMFVMAFNDFESSFRGLVSEILEYFIEFHLDKVPSKTNSDLSKKWKIEDVAKVLEIAGLIVISENRVLKKPWIIIGRYMELRHVFAHNANPIPNYKIERIEKIKAISYVKLDKRNFVNVTKISVIEKSCDIYETFINKLIIEISKRLGR